MRAARDSGRNWHLCQNVTVAWLHVASSREMASLFCLPHVALLISTVPVPARDISRPTGHVIDSVLTVPQLLSILRSIETNTHGISGHRTGSGHERALPAGRRLCRGPGHSLLRRVLYCVGAPFSTFSTSWAEDPTQGQAPP